VVRSIQLSKLSSITSNYSEISVYSDELARPETVKPEVKKLLAAFPDVDNDYLIVLIDRLIKNGFTRQRVTDAINHVIDNCHYKKPMIAEIVSFDKKTKLFTYEEICQKCTHGYSAFDRYERVEIDGRIRYFEK
jgi:hypothetical protein